MPDQVPQVPVEEARPEPSGTPWERREELGLWQAWAQTMQLALFEPGKLFAQARLDRGAAQLGFAVLTSSIFWAVGQILERALLRGQFEQMHKLLAGLGNLEVSPLLRKLLETSVRARPWPVVLSLALFTPVLAGVMLYLNAGVTHAVALLIGQSKRGFPATFAACAYSCAPLVLLAVPACGSIVAVVWLVVLTGIGMRETHRISPGGAAATVLAPYLLFCCLTILGSAALVVVMRNAMGQP